jgi:hypothetical protein
VSQMDDACICHDGHTHVWWLAHLLLDLILVVMWLSSLERGRPMELGDFFMMATCGGCLLTWEDNMLWRSVGHLGGGR